MPYARSAASRRSRSSRAERPSSPASVRFEYAPSSTTRRITRSATRRAVSGGRGALAAGGRRLRPSVSPASGRCPRTNSSAVIRRFPSGITSRERDQSSAATTRAGRVSASRLGHRSRGAGVPSPPPLPPAEPSAHAGSSGGGPGGGGRRRGRGQCPDAPHDLARGPRPVDQLVVSASASVRTSPRPRPAAAPPPRPRRSGPASRPAVRPRSWPAAPQRAGVLVGPMAVRRCSRIGPASRRGSILMVDTPVSARPSRIARCTGAAPRSRGSSEKWTFTGIRRAAPTAPRREGSRRRPRRPGRPRRRGVHRLEPGPGSNGGNLGQRAGRAAVPPPPPAWKPASRRGRPAAAGA